jgi:hypothetical protein
MKRYWAVARPVINLRLFDKQSFERKQRNMLAFMGVPGPIELLIIIAMVTVVVVPFWCIFSKAGFPGALSLLMLFPFVNFIMLFVLAFAEWPALREKKED